MRHSTAIAGAPALWALGLFALCTAASPAQADPRTLVTAGLWSAYADTTRDNRALCGIATVGADGRRIEIQQFAGQSGVVLALTKDSWAIPDNTGIDLRFQFDLSDQIPARATGGGRNVSVALTFDQSVPFMRALRLGRQIRVFFLSGNEAVWTGGLSGSGRAIDAFNDCRASLTPSSPTQPFSPPSAQLAPTQPFAAPPAPPAPTPPAPASQPFAAPDQSSPALAPTGTPNATDLPPIPLAPR